MRPEFKQSRPSPAPPSRSSSSFAWTVRTSELGPAERIQGKSAPWMGNGGGEWDQRRRINGGGQYLDVEDRDYPSIKYKSPSRNRSSHQCMLIISSSGSYQYQHAAIFQSYPFKLENMHLRSSTTSMKGKDFDWLPSRYGFYFLLLMGSSPQACPLSLSVQSTK